MGDQLGERVVLRSPAGGVSTKKTGGLGIADRLRLDGRRAPHSEGHFDGRRHRALETFELSELPSSLAAVSPVRARLLSRVVCQRRQET